MRNIKITIQDVRGIKACQLFGIKINKEYEEQIMKAFPEYFKKELQIEHNLNLIKAAESAGIEVSVKTRK